MAILTVVASVHDSRAMGKAPSVYTGVCPLMTLRVTFTMPVSAIPANVTVTFAGTADCTVTKDGVLTLTRAVTLTGSVATLAPTFTCLAGVATGTAAVAVPAEGGFGNPSGNAVLTYYGAGATLVVAPTLGSGSMVEGTGTFVQDPSQMGEVLDVATCAVPGESLGGTTWTGAFAFSVVSGVNIGPLGLGGTATVPGHVVG